MAASQRGKANSGPKQTNCVAEPKKAGEFCVISIHNFYRETRFCGFGRNVKRFAG